MHAGTTTGPPSTAHVFGPTMPSTARSCAAWKDPTAASVSCPKIPSASIGMRCRASSPESLVTHGPSSPRCSFGGAFASTPSAGSVVVAEDVEVSDVDGAMLVDGGVPADADVVAMGVVGPLEESGDVHATRTTTAAAPTVRG